MKIIARFIILNCLFLHYVSAQAQTSNEKFISSNDRHLDYMGRVGFADSSAQFYWTGTSVSINVKGAKEVKALLEINRDTNFCYVIVDGNSSSAKKIKLGTEKKMYLLATFSDLKKHHIELVKITNTDDNTIRFYGFEIDKNGSVLNSDKEKKRKLEFFGDSITCGHGVEVPVDSTDSGAPKYFNNYKTYDAITARYFDAQYHCTAKSGIGVTVSWFPQIMPEIYDRVNPNDSNSKWNFSSYIPDIVVVNLYQNDSWLVNQPNNEEFKARFVTVKPTDDFMIKAYADFISKIRTKYPKAQIICCLGNMDIVKEESKWPGIVDAAVATLNDNKITTHFFLYKNTNGHPKIKEQQAMADDLIEFIKKQKYWK
ncbi:MULTISPECIES: SGNH/GDSL hydrolase family protein [unclassified Flavobacterium]|jgi:lysophospholipase L1-like esterase|uniref:SGNH/GDSL hydrolase family protein n=1 Tax=unclassified Flavobacterium TaxID=196869 RepID=UPI0025C22AB6|nr:MULTISPECIES: SGNH/GDSL hydrolase family protein [unclassified Flavobacterium]